MAGLMDILLALVKVLCGSSTTEEQPSSEYQRPRPEKPPHQEAVTTYPEPKAAPEPYRQVSTPL